MVDQAFLFQLSILHHLKGIIMEGKESYTDVLVRLDQRLKDFIGENKGQHMEIITDIKELTSHVNHEIEAICIRIQSLEDSRTGQDAINKNNKEKVADKYQKLREYSLLVGFAVSATSIITFLLNHPHLLTIMVNCGGIVKFL